MDPNALLQAVDEVATRAPGRSANGYSDTQSPWRDDAEIEHSRGGIRGFLSEMLLLGLHGTWLQIGLGRHGGGHRAFRLLAQRVITVERAGDRIAAFCAATAGDLDDSRDVFVHGDSHAVEVRRQVAAMATGCDVLFVDGGDTFADVRADLEAYATLVRPGGVVAVADRSQARAGGMRADDVDRLVAELERDWLLPRGVRWQRAGGAHAIHWFVQTAATAEPMRMSWPSTRGVVEPCRSLGEHAGFSLHSCGDRWVAVSGVTDELLPDSLAANEHRVVLQAPSKSVLATLAETFAAVEPQLAGARDLLRRGSIGDAAGVVGGVLDAYPGLRQALMPSLEAAPFGKAMLLAIGTLALFDGEPRVGAALLRAALAQGLLDKELLPALANVYTDVLRDETAARELLRETKTEVLRRKRAQVCHERLRGHLLWSYPELLRDVRGVLQVGAHTGEEVEAFQLLEIGAQAYVEPQPAAFAQLRRRCEELGVTAPVLLPCALGSEPGEGVLRLGMRSDRASLLRQHPLARVPAAEAQTREVAVPVQTLDGLVAAGKLDPGRYNLLLIDTEGSELEVLRGSKALLRHVDVVCVAVFHEPVYAGAPLPQEIQTFLRELGDDAFALRAFAPGPHPARGDALFRRIKVRR